MAAFEGFQASFFSFFEELKENNDREWFSANKARYEQDVVAPVLDFIEAMQPLLHDISPNFLAIPKKTGGSMFRIYKDVRFSRDKRPYKEHAAIQFRHAAGRDAHTPGFYVHLGPGNVRYGGGVWMPASEPLKQIREAIASDRSGWQKVRRDKKMNATFDTLRGDSLMRPPRGFAADHPFIDDIKLKSFFVMHAGSEDVAARPDFTSDVAEAFAAAAPLMRFLCRALGVSF